MGWVSTLLESRTTLKDPARWLIDWFGGGPETATGIRVTPDTAMRATAVWCAVKILAETLASLPLFLYERLNPQGKARVENSLATIIHDQWNPWQTSMEAREMMMGHLVLRGNAYAEIVQERSGQVEMLVPLHPDRVRPFWASPGNPAYEYTPPNQGKRVIFLPGEILHIRGLSSNGLVGLSPIQQCRESIGLTMAAEEYGARFFSNDGTPGGILEHPGRLSDSAKKNIKEAWHASYGGVENKHRMAVLEEGMKWHQIGINSRDSQFIETRQFQIPEIARIFRIPPHMLMDLSRATFSNIEEQGIEFVVHTLRPWLVRWEQAMKRDLLLESEKPRLFMEFLVDGLLRGNLKARYDAYAIGRQWGWLSADDVRSFENMNPLPDGQGEMYLVPMNMVPADMVEEVVKPEPVEAEPVDDENDAPAPKQKKLQAASLPMIQDQRARDAGVTGRRQVQEVYRKLIKRTMDRLMQKELKAIRAAISKLDGTGGPMAMKEWLADFYRDLEVKLIARNLQPLVMGYTLALAEQVGDEIGQDIEVDSDIERQAGQVAAAMASRYVRSGLGQMVELLQESGDQWADALSERLDEWTETRAEKTAFRESVQIGSAMALFLMTAAGVTLYRWVAVGQSCPLCEQLHNKVVGRDQSFVQKGDKVDPRDGKTAPLEVKGHVRHPPLHQGCDCVIVADKQ